jgi:4-aminobutyrate---pyruvate transaminase
MLPPRSLAARDVASLVHPFTEINQHADRGPMVIERGEGIYVFDEAGNRYLEGMAGLWCVSLGFSERRLVEAGLRQMRRLPAYHLFGGKSYAPAVELAERLLAMALVPMARALFASSGSEANDTAIKLVRYYNHARGRPEKQKIIARARAYHGVTLGAASLTGLPHAHEHFGLPLEGFLHAECPHHYRFALPGESEEAYATRLAESLDRLIVREGAETIAAFIAEPLMGAGGVILPPATYFEKVQEVLRRHEVLLIADEVITGFARTGAMFGSQAFGLRPDLMTLAKGLSSGYAPIAAVLISDPIFEALASGSGRVGTFGHGFTYGGHPVASAIALKTLRIYEEDDVLAQVRKVAPHFAERVLDLAAHPLVGHARAMGLVGAVELMADGAERTPFAPSLRVGARVVEHALREGLILRPLADVVSFCPPLIITSQEIDRMFDAVALALKWAAAELAREPDARVA